MESTLQTVEIYLFSVSFFHGALVTLELTLASTFFGICIGLILALMRQSTWLVFKLLAFLYLWVFRGTPVLLQILFIYNVLPQFGIVLSGFVSGVVALALNEGAYMSEIVRSGLQSVRQGQRTAGMALGMKPWQVMRYIVLPQATRVFLPPMGNQLIGMLKLSSLVSVIAVQDLLLIANQTASANFRYIEALSAAGIYYLGMTTIFMIVQGAVEHKLSRRSVGRASTKKTLAQHLVVLRDDRSV